MDQQRVYGHSQRGFGRLLQLGLGREKHVVASSSLRSFCNIADDVGWDLQFAAEAQMAWKSSSLRGWTSRSRVYVRFLWCCGRERLRRRTSSGSHTFLLILLRVLASSDNLRFAMSMTLCLCHLDVTLICAVNRTRRTSGCRGPFTGPMQSVCSLRS